MFQRCFANVETTSINVRRLNFHFQPNINVDVFAGNVVRIHKRDDKQNVKNYGPVSLLPIFGKIFERLIYIRMYSFFIENNLISPNEPSFKPGDSFINQLLSIIHDIHQSFDQCYESRSRLRGVLLDIPMAFDKV